MKNTPYLDKPLRPLVEVETLRDALGSVACRMRGSAVNACSPERERQVKELIEAARYITAECDSLLSLREGLERLEASLAPFAEDRT